MNLMFQIAELTRRLHNILRVGTVSEVDTAKARARVAIGELLTDWLPWYEPAAGNTRTWRAPSVGEQVMVLSPSGELRGGTILRGLNRTDFPAPSADEAVDLIRYRDGTTLRYDAAAHKLVAEVQGSVELTATGTLTATVSGAARIETAAALTLKGASITLDGPVTATSTIDAQDDVTGGGISLINHVHGGVQTGGSKTSKPE